MAIRVQKLNIDDTIDGAHYECSCYSTTAEAIPTTGNSGSGSCWEIKVGGDVSYIGLWNASNTNTPPRDVNDTSKKNDNTTDLPVVTPLTIKKDGITYKAMRYVLNTKTITVNALTNQTGTLVYYDVNGTEHTETITTAKKTFTALYGTTFTFSLTANTGYTKGTPSVSSGVISDDINITATSATNAPYLITVNVPTGAKITVDGEDFTESGTTTKNYQQSINISCSPINSAQYEVYNLTANGVAITSGSNFTVPANAFTITCASTVRQYNVTIVEGVGTKLTVTANSKNVANGDVYNYGTVLTYSVADISGDAYENPQCIAYETIDDYGGSVGEGE